MPRTALLHTAKPGRESSYREWPAGAAGQLEDGYARHGVREATVLAAGPRFIEHYESDDPQGILGVLAEPAFSAVLNESLVSGTPGPTALYEEIFAWETTAPRTTVERAALILTLQDGKEQAYREWLVSGVLAELEQIWHRNQIWRHDVLAKGTSLIAYYECESRFNVLKAFREPEALAMLMGDLGKLVVLDPYVPFTLFEQTFFWEGSR